MISYKTLYFTLFNAITDALEASDFETAKALLQQAQIDAEEAYISAGEGDFEYNK